MINQCQHIGHPGARFVWGSHFPFADRVKLPTLMRKLRHEQQYSILRGAQDFDLQRFQEYCLSHCTMTSGRHPESELELDVCDFNAICEALIKDMNLDIGTFPTFRVMVEFPYRNTIYIEAAGILGSVTHRIQKKVLRIL